MNEIAKEQRAQGGWEAGVGRRARGGRCRADLIVEGADVQGRVPRGVLGSRLSPIEEQVFQVLRMAPLAGLERIGSGGGWNRPTWPWHLPVSFTSRSGSCTSTSPSPFNPHSCLGTHAASFASPSKAQGSGLAAREGREAIPTHLRDRGFQVPRHPL